MVAILAVAAVLVEGQRQPHLPDRCADALGMNADRLGQVLLDVGLILGHLVHRLFERLALRTPDASLLNHLVDLGLGPMADDGDASADRERLLQRVDVGRPHHDIAIVQHVENGSALTDQLGLTHVLNVLARGLHLLPCDLDPGTMCFT